MVVKLVLMTPVVFSKVPASFFLFFLYAAFSMVIIETEVVAN